MKLVVVIFSLAILFFACKKNKTEIDFGYDYVPLDSGVTIVYQVRDIFHDEALVPANDTSYYQIKTVLSEQFVDEVGDTATKLKRFIRDTELDDWEIKDVWTIKNTITRSEIVEENKRIIDFIFAPSLSKTWNANVYNDLGLRNSEFTAVHKPFNIIGFSFDSACVISHQDFSTFIDYNIEYDVFAKGIGKVYSLVKELRINNSDTLDIKKGFEIEYRVIEYSN